MIARIRLGPNVRGEKEHETPEVRAFYADVATDVSRQVFHGEDVVVVFDSPVGTELARVSRR